MSLNSYVANYPEFTSLLNTLLQQELNITTDPTQLQFLGTYVNMLASLAENEMFYISMLANESFMSTAITPDAITQHAISMGYQIKNATAASGYITFYIPIDRLTIPQFQVMLSYPTFTTNTGITYTCPYNVTLTYNNLQNITSVVLQTNYQTRTIPTLITQFIDPNNNLRTVLLFNLPIIQAQLANINYVISSTDITNNKLPIIPITLNSYFNESDLQAGQIGTISVYVNNIAYTQVPNIFSMKPNQQAFVVQQTPSTINIILGNGIFGNVQQIGSTVNVIIPLTMGSLGNILSNTLSLNNTTLTHNFTGATLEYYLSNQPITSGTNGDNYSQIRTNAIANLATNNRLVTASDYSTLANQSNLILDSMAIVKRSDLLANQTSIFLVPQLQLPTGVRPLKACSGVLEIPNALTPNITNLVVKQGQPITIYVYDYPSDPTLTPNTSIQSFSMWTNYPQWTDFTTWYTLIPNSL